MPSSWTTNINWTTDTPISVDRLNAFIGLNGNTDYALGNKGLQIVDYSGGDFSITTAGFSAFTDVDATNAKITCTTMLGRVLVLCQGVATVGSAAAIDLDLFDGTNYASTGTSTPATNGLWVGNASGAAMGFLFFGWFPSVGAGNTLTCKLRAKAVAATSTIRASATAHLKMLAFEF